MARCGCSGAICSCVVTGDGTTATVSGAGSVGNPFVVTSLAGQTFVNVLDTPTLDLSITGTGTAGNPYVISGAVIDTDTPTSITNGNGIGPVTGAGTVASPFVITACLSTDVGNALTFGADGCLFSPPAAAGTTTTVAPLDTSTVNTTVTGGPNYVVSADVIISPDAGNTLVAHPNGLFVPDVDVVLTNGNGISPIVGGLIKACLSTDAGNVLTFGADGCLFAPPPGAAAATVIQAQDTQCVDMTVSGLGTIASPFLISAVPIIDPVVGNILTCGPAGLSVLDTDTAVTVAPAAATPTFLATVTGGPAFLVGGNVKISATAGNTLVANADGLFVPDVDTATSITNGPGIGPVTGAGTIASPFVITACLSTDAGNTLTFGTDGCLLATATPITVACGLLGTGTVADPLKTNTPAVWPFACADTNGTDIYCGADGVLRGPPEKFSAADCAVASFGTGQLNTFGAPVGGGLTGLNGGNSFTLVNPSPCLPMNVQLQFGVNHADFHSFVAGASRVELIPAYSSVGTTADATLNQGGHQLWEADGLQEMDTQGASSKRSHVIPAGGSATFSIFSFMQVDNYNGNTTLTNYQTFVCAQGSN